MLRCAGHNDGDVQACRPCMVTVTTMEDAGEQMKLPIVTTMERGGMEPAVREKRFFCTSRDPVRRGPAAGPCACLVSEMLSREGESERRHEYIRGFRLDAPQ